MEDLTIIKGLYAITPDQKDNDLIHKFTIDFAAEKLGMPHQMRFGAYSLYSKTPNNKNLAELSR